MTKLSKPPASYLADALGLTAPASPFPWQVRLLDQLLGGDMPTALDIPTGLGKTAVMAIWLVARALGAAVPRRLVYGVDRRAVVDQATSEAERLQAWVDDHSELRQALGLQGSLAISTLRGQHVDNRRWLEDPASPAIVIGTVDMIGSRLLFGGYGVSRRMRPYHAGLLGADSLIVLDEAHLVEPFERLVEGIASGQDANGRPLGSVEGAEPGLVPALRFLSLSATGRERPAGEVFRLSRDDFSHPVVRKRLAAVKRLFVHEPVLQKDLPDALAERAWEVSKQGTAGRVIVFCNRREHAQKVQAALEKKAGGSDRIDIELIVGERRVYEREQAAQWLRRFGFLAGAQTPTSRAAFVVATSAGEVGVDLDADHAVCDLVSWERMVQRLGRVNRRGEGAADIHVLPSMPEAAQDKTGEHKHRLERVLQLLRSLPAIGTTTPEAHDASPAALTELKTDARLRETVALASSPTPLHPPLTRALVESWSMTSLEDHTGRPDLEPWLRGWLDEQDEPQTTVVWRQHLPLTHARQLLASEDLEAFRSAADPHLSERLEAGTSVVLAWLAKRLEALRQIQKKSAEPLPAGSQDWAHDETVLGVILDPAQGRDRLLQARHLREPAKSDIEYALRGATLMVDARLGGLVRGLLKDESAAVDEINVSSLEPPIADRVVPFRTRLSKEEPSPKEKGDPWRTELALVVAEDKEAPTQWLIVETLAELSAESEDARSSARRAQYLEEHQSWAEEEARRLAQSLALPEPHVELLAFSARMHDEGKQAPQWQRAFQAPGGGKLPYAKTTSRPIQSVLAGYRHELGSLPYAEAHPRFQNLTPEMRELALHLIAAHHGHARPSIPTLGASEPPSRLEARAREIALRFAAMERRWGPWGLAWWEALLRAADQRASKRNDDEGRKHG